jgi:ADP-ribose pyrophosphatase YjhB (NUDIX family)
MDTLISFCTLCGNNLSLRIPAEDDRERHVCDTCGHIHYQNPRIIVCALPCHEDKVLLCKRAIEPRHGLWTLPGGFMENNESTLEAALRETREEACARIRIRDLYSLYNVIHINQVHLFFRAELLDLDFAAGAESLEVGLFGQHEVPWHEIAFPAVASTLQQYFLDLPQQQFPLRLADVVLGANNTRIIRPHNFVP